MNGIKSSCQGRCDLAPSWKTLKVTPLSASRWFAWVVRWAKSATEISCTPSISFCHAGRGCPSASNASLKTDCGA